MSMNFCNERSVVNIGNNFESGLNIGTLLYRIYNKHRLTRGMYLFNLFLQIVHNKLIKIEVLMLYGVGSFRRVNSTVTFQLQASSIYIQCIYH